MLIRTRAPANSHRRSIRIPSGGENSLDDLGGVMHAHEDHERLRNAGLRPIDLVNIMSGHEGDHGSVLAMGQRYAGIRRDAERRSDAGDDFKSETGFRQRFDFFAAASEDERIAAFQSHDRLALTSLAIIRSVISACVMGVVAALFADIDALG